MLWPIKINPSNTIILYEINASPEMEVDNFDHHV